ncbi:MAG TPA: DUF2905 domain-containing protein [Vicinamibacteria bacterium]|nr:DUF2905 domain-containing protein [Vicinamibacteria bacterium]
MPELGRLLLIIGGVIIVLGLVLTFAGRVPWVGRLPGDLAYRRGNLTLYFPLATSILLSLVLTALLWLLRR